MSVGVYWQFSTITKKFTLTTEQRVVVVMSFFRHEDRVQPSEETSRNSKLLVMKLLMRVTLPNMHKTKLFFVVYTIPKFHLVWKSTFTSYYEWKVTNIFTYNALLNACFKSRTASCEKHMHQTGACGFTYNWTFCKRHTPLENWTAAHLIWVNWLTHAN
jgi:hypothetical protein